MYARHLSLQTIWVGKITSKLYFLKEEITTSSSDRALTLWPLHLPPLHVSGQLELLQHLLHPGWVLDQGQVLLCQVCHQVQQLLRVSEVQLGLILQGRQIWWWEVEALTVQQSKAKSKKWSQETWGNWPRSLSRHHLGSWGATERVWNQEKTLRK